MSVPPVRPRVSILRIALVLVAIVVGVSAVCFGLLRSPTHEVDVAVPADATSPPAPEIPRDEPLLRGRILSAEGEPVNGATVHLVSTAAPLAVLAEATSAADGSFSFPRVAPGSVHLAADHGADGFVSSAALAVADAALPAVTLVLSPSRGVRGTVEGPDHHPVVGVIVSIDGLPWTVPTATSDDAGAFHLTVVPDEATALVATAHGYAPARLALGHRDNTELLVRIELSTAPPISGVVYGVDGEGVRAQVFACAGQRAEVHVSSGDDGTFQLPASAIGCDAFAEQGGASSQAVALADARQVTLRLLPGGSIEGAVVDDRGAGVPAFTVGIESFTSSRGRRGTGSGGRRFEDIAGAFRLDQLAPGTYVLTASAAGKPPTRSDPVEVTAGAVTRGVRITLAQGGAIVGRVVDEHLRPLADVDVRFDTVSRVVDSNSSTRTDDTGRFHLDGAPAGPVTLRASKTGFRMQLVSGLSVASGRSITQDITLVATEGGAGLELGGIGASLLQSDKGIEIAALGSGDPADRAGLKKGDRIVRIDGESTDAMSVADVVQRLRGTAGTTVGVSVDRPATGERIDVVMVRATIVR